MPPPIHGCAADGVKAPDVQQRIQAGMQRGFQTRDAELNFGEVLGWLSETD